MSCFDPQEIIERFLAGDWNDHPLYWAAYQDIWQKQSAFVRLAEGLRRFQVRETPHDPPKNPQAAILEKEILKAVQNNDTAYLKRLLRAGQLLKNGRLKWRFTLSALIILAIIDLRENHRRPRIDKSELRRLVVKWQRTNDPSTISDESQWSRALKRPDIVKLLTLQQNK